MKGKRKLIYSLLLLIAVGSLYVGHYLSNPTNRTFISSKITSLYLALGNEITYLEVPEGLQWKEGSTATAKWNAVNNANYYTVYVYVYISDTEIGNTVTGTSNAEIDLQHEINTIVSGRDLSTVQVKFKVTALYIDDNGADDITSETSEISNSIDYTVGTTTQLAKPINLNFTESYAGTWSFDANADFYSVRFKFTTSSGTSYTVDGYSYNFTSTGSSEAFTVNLTEYLENAYKTEGLTGQNVTVSFSAKSWILSGSTKNYKTGDWSEWSNGVSYYNEEQIIQLLPPTNLNFTESYVGTWSFDANADFYSVRFKFTTESGSSYIVDGYTYNFTSKGSGETFTASLASYMDNAYKTKGLSGQNVTVSFSVKSWILSGLTKNYKTGNWSEWSNGVSYYNEEQIIQLLPPTNLIFKDTFTGSWSFDENADFYSVRFKFTTSSGTSYTVDGYSYNFTSTGSSEAFTVSLKSYMESAYNSKSLGPEPVIVSFSVKSWILTGSTKNYRTGTWSEWSNEVVYNPGNYSLVEKITLSPNQPVIALGKSLYIGKTITPEDGYYSTIRWSSSNSNIVSINSSGQITGKKVGSTYITAKILNVEQTALVSAYEINSNITDSTQSKKVVDEAINIIDSIITDQDASNTDITDVDKAVEGIENGAQNENQFKVDINYNEKIDTDYLSIKDAIEEKYSGMNIGGGYDIAIELYHSDDEGTKHHIANITELETNVDFKFNIPDSLPELSNTKTREYQLVRYHDGQLENIDATFNNDGAFSSSSDKFSDFILLYQDTDIPVTDLTVDKTSITLNVGEESTIEVAIAPENAANKNYSSESSNTSVATVDGNKITAVGIGTTTVTFTSTDGGFAKTVTVAVLNKLASISLNKESGSLNVGEDEILAVTYNPIDTTDNKTVTWSSSDSTVATVENGTVTAVNIGTATITATVGSKTATYSLTVYSPLKSIGLNKTSGVLELRETETLTVTYNPTDTTDDKTVTWTTSNNKIATVENGTVTAVSAGTATITATVGSKTATYEVEVKEYPLEKITLNKTTLEIDLGIKESLIVKYNPTNTTDDKTITWSSSNEKIAKVEDGIITGVGYGTATITATVGSKTATCVVTVKEYPLESISLNKTNGTITIGNSETLAVTYNPTNTTDYKTVIWTSSDESIATVENGKVTGVAVGTTKITAKVGSKTVTYTVTVKEATTLYKIVTEKGFKAENGLVHGLTLGDTIANLKSELGNNVTINTSNSIIGTGVQMSYDGETYTAVVRGDITGDGVINSADLLKMRQHLLGTNNLTGAYKKAASIVNGSMINSADLLRLRQYLLGTNKIDQ